MNTTTNTTAVSKSQFVELGGEVRDFSYGLVFGLHQETECLDVLLPGGGRLIHAREKGVLVFEPEAYTRRGITAFNVPIVRKTDAGYRGRLATSGEIEDLANLVSFLVKSGAKSLMALRHEESVRRFGESTNPGLIFDAEAVKAFRRRFSDMESQVAA